MKIKTQLTLAAVIAAGMLASGCSQQMAGQHVAQAAPVVVDPVVDTSGSTVEETVQTIVDCSKCAQPKPVPTPRPVVRPTPRPKPKPKPVQQRRPVGQWGHTHPAIPGCTNSVTHTHKYTNPNHKHRYGCTGGKRPARPTPRPAVRPTPRPRPPAPVVRPQVPVKPAPVVVVPQVKAKGTYRGPITIDSGVMQQYRQ